MWPAKENKKTTKKSDPIVHQRLDDVFNELMEIRKGKKNLAYCVDQNHNSLSRDIQKEMIPFNLKILKEKYNKTGDL